MFVVMLEVSNLLGCCLVDKTKLKQTDPGSASVKTSIKCLALYRPSTKYSWPRTGLRDTGITGPVSWVFMGSSLPDDLYHGGARVYRCFRMSLFHFIFTDKLIFNLKI